MQKYLYSPGNVVLFDGFNTIANSVYIFLSLIVRSLA